mmetsp:Transcript_126157/g.306556  ORF Transcript_126157/g.306556 Transcript_126157/m.306556 type:complete len:91 (+) Transcript_126157:223-495(+)
MRTFAVLMLEVEVLFFQNSLDGERGASTHPPRPDGGNDVDDDLFLALRFLPSLSHHSGALHRICGPLLQGWLIVGGISDTAQLPFARLEA